jgi:hypothetical protein
MPKVSSQATQYSRFSETLCRDLFRSPLCDDVAVSIRFNALARTTFEDTEVAWYTEQIAKQRRLEPEEPDQFIKPTEPAKT